MLKIILFYASVVKVGKEGMTSEERSGDHKVNVIKKMEPPDVFFCYDKCEEGIKKKLANSDARTLEYRNRMGVLANEEFNNFAQNRKKFRASEHQA